MKCNEAIIDTAGVVPKFFRAPVGHHNLFVYSVLRAMKYRHIGWSARGDDGVSCDPEKVAERLKKQIRPGSIILLHVGHGKACEVTKEVLEYIKDKGWRITCP